MAATSATGSKVAASWGCTPAVKRTVSGYRAAIAWARPAAVIDSPMHTIPTAPVWSARAITASASDSNAESARWEWLSRNAAIQNETAAMRSRRSDDQRVPAPAGLGLGGRGVRPWEDVGRTSVLDARGHF